MRSRILTCLTVILLGGLVFAPVVHPQPPAAAPGEDFPLGDYQIWLFLERGLKNQAADRQLARAPESPETVALLLDAYRTSDALSVLRRIVERRPERIAAAFKVAAANGHRFEDEGRGYPAVLREIVARARQRIRELPREQAAEVSWHLRFLPVRVPGETQVPWRDQLRAFVAEYAGTRTALLGELTLLDEGRDMASRITALEAFARTHANTELGAQALYTAAMHLASNVRDLPGADPTERLQRVAALGRELQSGAYPDCEWVRRVPQLVLGFFFSEAQYAKEHASVVLDVFREFVSKDFDISVNPLGNGVGYLITRKVPPLLGGEPIPQTERLLLELEKTVKESAAVRYLRGLWYRQLADTSSDVAAKNEWRRKADATLLDLSRTGAGLYHRKALASLASTEFTARNCNVAVDRYREYLSRFPESRWAWVAALRMGQCEQFLGNWIEARRAYESATSMHDAPPPALVLGHTFAGRASESLDDYQHARAAYERAERAWDPRFADMHFGTYQFYTRLDEERCNGCDPRSNTDVSRDWLRRRLAQLKESLSVPGVALLERGRFFVTQGSWRNAVAPLDEFIRLHPDSPSAREARELRTRAKLEIALLQAGPEATEEGRRAALSSLDALAAAPYGFSLFAAQVARATLQSILGSTERAAQLMSDALARWHDHSAARFAKGGTTALQRDVIEIRDVVFDAGDNRGRDEFSHLRSPDSPPRFFIVAPDVRVRLHDDAEVRVEAASRLASRPGALLLDAEQITVLERILTGLGGTKRHAPREAVETPNEPIQGVEHIEKFWNRFFTMGPGHWGGWILEAFPIVTEITFIDAARTKGAARIRTGYQGSTQLVTKVDGRWKITGSSGHWIE